MTYCLAIELDAGLVFCSDSRTNAGPDRVSTYSKMHRFAVPGERSIVVLTAGNLATCQAVLTRLQRELEEQSSFNLFNARYVADIADHVGELSLREQGRYAQKGGEDAGFNASATFIVGGQIRGHSPELYMVYPEGNHIAASDLFPYLQIGEAKYGKPILDRIIRRDTPVEIALRCALVSVDSTMRSNATVGPPLECLFYRRDSLEAHEHYCKLDDRHPYLLELRERWDENIRGAVDQLPSLSAVFEAGDCG